MVLEHNTCIFRNEKIPWRIIEGEAILVEISTGEVIHLNEIGAEVWNYLDDKKQISEIIQHICDIFEVDKEVAQKDVLEFIQLLLDKGLVSIFNG